MNLSTTRNEVLSLKSTKEKYQIMNVNNSLIRETPELMKILIKDRTTRRNIIWATDSYSVFGKEYYRKEPIKLNLVTNGAGDLIKPRAAKLELHQENRTRDRAEVFTPTWIIKKQNDLVEREFKNLPLNEYVNKVWLEITCGEGPYIASRYDTVTGESIEIKNRVGFLDRKIQRISKETEDYKKWIKLVQQAYKSSFGYEFQGDSLLMARENLIYTFIDYHLDKFDKIPQMKEIEKIAKIISYNIFQMDGLNYIIPLSREIEKRDLATQLNLLDAEYSKERIEVIREGTNVKIKNWNNNRLVEFKNILNQEGGILMKFDVVIGNPPYQEDNKNRNRDDAIYHYFMDSSYMIGDKVVLITPGRFLFDVGSTPKSWNKKMLTDNHLKIVYYEPDSSKVFNSIDIKGGVAITYRDKGKKFESIDVFIPYKEIASAVRKISKVEGTDYGRFGEIMYVQNKFDLDVLYKDYPEFKNRISSKGKERRLTSSIFNLISEIFKDEKSKENNVGIYGRENNERIYKYINSKYLEKHSNFNKWKIFVPAANGSGEFGEVLSSPVVGNPGIGHTQTFISIGAFDTEFEALACLNYIKTKFARAMLGVMKVTQNNKTKETWSKIPLQDFTTNSDINWSKSIAEIDRQLYKKYNLNEDEINFIESNVREME